VKLTDLRGILQYIPQFREKTFIIEVDGAIVTDENFGNILLDVAVLRSLNIRVVLVHGAAAKIKALGADRNIKAYNLEGTVIEQFKATTKQYVGQMMRVVRANEIPSQLMEVFGGVGIALVFFYVVNLPKDRQPQSSDFFAFILTIVGFLLLTAGGTMGGSITYVHGMRVLNLVDEPTRQAVVPSMAAEKKAAEGG